MNGWRSISICQAKCRINHWVNFKVITCIFVQSSLGVGEVADDNTNGKRQAAAESKVHGMLQARNCGSESDSNTGHGHICD